MQPETLMLYKLIILYILDRVDFPMTNAQLTNFITDRQYTSYFNVQQVLTDLVDDGYITLEQKRNAAFYRITPDGHEALIHAPRRVLECGGLSRGPQGRICRRAQSHGARDDRD